MGHNESGVSKVSQVTFLFMNSVGSQMTYDKKLPFGFYSSFLGI